MRAGVKGTPLKRSLPPSATATPTKPMDISQEAEALARTPSLFVLPSHEFGDREAWNQHQAKITPTAPSAAPVESEDYWLISNQQLQQIHASAQKEKQLYSKTPPVTPRVLFGNQQKENQNLATARLSQGPNKGAARKPLMKNQPLRVQRQQVAGGGRSASSPPETSKRLGSTTPSTLNNSPNPQLLSAATSVGSTIPSVPSSPTSSRQSAAPRPPSPAARRPSPQRLKDSTIPPNSTQNAMEKRRTPRQPASTAGRKLQVPPANVTSDQNEEGKPSNSPNRSKHRSPRPAPQEGPAQTPGRAQEVTPLKNTFSVSNTKGAASSNRKVKKEESPVALKTELNVLVRTDSDSSFLLAEEEAALALPPTPPASKNPSSVPREHNGSPLDKATTSTTPALLDSPCFHPDPTPPKISPPKVHPTTTQDESPVFVPVEEEPHQPTTKVEEAPPSRSTSTARSEVVAATPDVLSPDSVGRRTTETTAEVKEEDANTKHVETKTVAVLTVAHVEALPPSPPEKVEAKVKEREGGCCNIQ